MRTAALLGVCLVIGLFSNRTALAFEGKQSQAGPGGTHASGSKARLTTDMTPCSADNPQHVPADKAFAHARLIRLTGHSADGGRLACWLGIAADQGLAEAQMQLAFLFYDAEPLPNHLERAAQWMELAANQSNLIAEVRLSQFYENGEGVKADAAAAKHWMDKALAQAAQTGQLQGSTPQQKADFLLTLATTAGVSAGLATDRDAEYLKNTDAPTRKILCSQGFDRYCSGDEKRAMAGDSLVTSPTQPTVVMESNAKSLPDRPNIAAAGLPSRRFNLNGNWSASYGVPKTPTDHVVIVHVAQTDAHLTATTFKTYEQNVAHDVFQGDYAGNPFTVKANDLFESSERPSWKTTTITVVSPDDFILGNSHLFHRVSAPPLNAFPCTADNPFHLTGFGAFRRGIQAEVAKEVPLSKCWYELSLSLGYVEAEGRLGVIAYTSTYPNHYKVAFDLFEDAAKKDDLVSEMALDDMYKKGLGVERDETKAAYWRQKAAPRKAIIDARRAAAVGQPKTLAESLGISKEDAAKMEAEAWRLAAGAETKRGREADIRQKQADDCKELHDVAACNALEHPLKYVDGKPVDDRDQ